MIAWLPVAVLVVGEPWEVAEMHGARWMQLRAAAEPGRAEPGPWVASRTLHVRAEPNRLRLTARWRLRARGREPFAARLFGPGVRIEHARIDGRDAAVVPGPTGTVLIEEVDRRAVLDVEAVIDLAPGGQPTAIALLAAAVGEVTVEGDFEAVGDDDVPWVRDGNTALGGGASLRLRPRPARGAAEAGPLAIAQIGVGITVGEAELRGQANLQWTLRRGELTHVAFDAGHIGSDATVEGPNVGEWKREGDRFDVELKEPARARVDLHLRWSTPVPAGERSRVAVPSLRPVDVWRTESALEISRDGDLDTIPDLRRWDAIAAPQLPTWGRDLVEGTPTAAFRHAGDPGEDAGQLELFRFVPVEAPPIVIDIADHLVATSDEGRALWRTRLAVRNERASHLRVRPPPGARLDGVRVAGRDVRASRRGDTWWIPLPRSVDTVRGLVPFPVVLAMSSESAVWKRRERRELALPILGAPVTVARVAVHLPPRFRSLLRPGEADVVEHFTRGDEVAMGFGEEAQATRAEVLFADAVEAWNTNDFQRARQRLDELDGMGARDEDTGKLKANVDLVLPPPKALDPTAMPEGMNAPVAEVSVVERRIKAQARVRASKRRTEQRGRKEKAKALRESGDYAAAAAEYEEILDTNKELDTLEDEESRAVDFEDDEIQGEMEEAKHEAAAAESLENDLLSLEHAPAAVVALARALIGAPDPEPSIEPEVVSAPPPAIPAPLVLVPQHGAAVRYELFVLGAEATPTVRVDARRRPEGLK